MANTSTGLFSDPANKKRLVKSTIVYVNGNPVLKQNNYSISEYLSVEQEVAMRDAPADASAAPPQRKSKREVKKETFYGGKRNNTKKVKVRNELVDSHLEMMRSSASAAAGERLVFISKHLEVFRAFLPNTILQKAGALGSKQQIDSDTTDASVPHTHTLLQFGADEQPSCTRDNAVMRDYQIAGLNFMLRMYTSGMSCVLADEMGLGKTIQTISFLGTLKADLKTSGPHLVVVPMSVLSNWMTELRRFCPSLKAVRYHCSLESEKTRIRRQVLDGFARGEVDVVVTTYEMLVSEKSSGLARLRYRVVVLDEAHKCKNSNALVSMACTRLTRQFTLLLTGTPLQNNLFELWSLLNCMQPDIFQDSTKFVDAFDASDMTKTNMGVVDSAFRMMDLVVLRRRKNDINISLPPKREVHLMCPLSSMQSFWYKRLLLMNAALFVGDYEVLKGNGVRVNSDAPVSDQAGSAPVKKLAALVMQLRKLSLHPYLFSEMQDGLGEETSAALVHASGKLHMLQRLLVKLKAEGHRAVIFSQFTSMLDIIEDFLGMEGYRFTRLDGGTNRVQRMINIQQFNKPNSSLFVFLLSTRAGGLGVNLHSADTCILFDSDWNPQMDLQAMARVHRIGQQKPVTIYRLVSGGTIEERIVARATRKLILDELVSKGSVAVLGTSSSASNVATGTEGGDSGDGGDEVETSEMHRALVFTMRRMFAAHGGNVYKSLVTDSDGTDADITDDQLDRTIAACLDGCSSDGTSNSSNEAAAEEKKEDLEDLGGGDDCTALTSTNDGIRKFRGEDFNAMVMYRCKSLRDIRSEWEDRQNRLSGSREKTSRMVTVSGGVGVGKIQVLKSNCYSISDGEPSVFEREARSGGKPPPPQKQKRFIAGRDYDNVDYCQACGDGGSVVMCDGCPMSYHAQCLGYTDMAELLQFEQYKQGIPGSTKKSNLKLPFRCPHHVCYTCNKSSGEASNLLFRCMGCPAAYCEDCINLDDVEVLATQPPEYLRSFGYDHCLQAVYITCSDTCAAVEKSLALPHA